MLLDRQLGSTLRRDAAADVANNIAAAANLGKLALFGHGAKTQHGMTFQGYSFAKVEQYHGSSCFFGVGRNPDVRPN